ncbi:TPA: hypothetical protein ACUI23_001064 [Staphylococcus pseudintermedius]
MTEKEKMINALPYYPSDATRVHDRQQAASARRTPTSHNASSI